MINEIRRAIEEVGLEKTLKFIFYSIVQVLYHTLIDHFLYFSIARKFILKILGAKIGKDAILMDIRFFNWHHLGPKGLKVGKDCFIGDETLIDLYQSVILEEQVTVAQRVMILTHLNVGYKNHPLQKYFPRMAKPVVLKKGCVIGAGAIILPGITIGAKAFVAAGSVVTKNVSPNSLVAGIPAKKLRNIK